MRRVLFIAALLALLAACSVDVEGAACDAIGQATQCPSGQLCGADRRCSVAAAACPAAPCQVGAKRCEVGESNTRICAVGTDGICSHWVDDTVCGPEKSCFDPDGAAAPECRCNEIVVDPDGVTPAAGSCHTATIAEAIDRATGLSRDQVRLVGDVVGGPATYSRDTAPLIIPAGFTVAGGDSPAAPLNRIVELGGGSGEAVRIEAGGALRGVTVRKASGPGATIGIEVKGASALGDVSISDVVVENPQAADRFVTNVLVSGTGAVVLQRLTLLDATGPGLEVSRSSVADTVAVSDLLAKRNDVGVSVKVGDLTLQRGSIEKSGAQGVVVSNATANQVGLELTSSTIKFSGRGGVFANNVKRLVMTGSKVCKNAALPQSVPGLSGSQRSLGGLVLSGEVPADHSLSGNAFHDNDGDQVALIGSAGTAWNFSAASCAAGSSNVFAGYDSTIGANSLPNGTGLFAAGVSATAVFAAWPAAPAANRDYLAASATVTSGNNPPTSFDYCSLVQVSADTSCAAVSDAP